MAAARRGVEAAALGGAALVLFMAGLFLPAGGLLTGLSPIPLVVLAGRWGLPVTAAVGAGAALIGFAVQARVALAFLLEGVAPALAMGAVARWAKTPVPPVLAGAGAGLVGVALQVGWGVGFRPVAAVAAFGAHVDGVLNDLVAGASRAGLPGEQVRDLAAWMGGLRDAVVALLPGLLTTAELLTAVLVYGVAGAILRRLGTSLPPLGEWRLADGWVWGFIGAGSLTVLPATRQLGLNLFVPVIGLYFVEGVAVAAELARRFRLPPGIWAFGLLLLLLQPLTAFAVAALGLFDIWCGFRRRERTAR
ncbi:MAG: YybS family protein [candidate division NC10 bacterium]|nr:YybS family protein [candidate division NC10 bacterium]